MINEILISNTNLPRFLSSNQPLETTLHHFRNVSAVVCLYQCTRMIFE
jgi:hypothetical protein